MLDVLKEVFRYRELLWSLAERDLKIRYKQSFLGVAWALFTPLATMLIFALVAYAQILKVDTGGVPYMIFAYCGILPWTFFASTLSTSTSCLVSNSNLITKIYFPREVFPLSLLLSKFVDFLLAAVVLVALMIYYRVPLRLPIVALPMLVLVQVLFMIGMSFFLSMGNLFYRDVKYVFDVVITLWMFGTSVIYPIQLKNPLFQQIFLLNPMTPIINGYRNVVIFGIWPDCRELLPVLVIVLAVFWAGTYYFHRNEFLFAERI